MDNDKYKRGRLNKQLREIADEMGYTPGEFSLMRFAEDAKKLKAWAADLDRGLIPEELGHLPWAEASKLIRREIKDLIERERSWLSFFYPTMKSMELGGSLTIERKAEELSDDELAAIAAGRGK